MAREPDCKNIDESFWDRLRESACTDWDDACPHESCNGCIFDAPKDEWKEWLKNALIEQPKQDIKWPGADGF